MVALIYNGIFLKDSFSDVLRAAYSYLKWSWFLWTYLALTLFAPLLNVLFEKKRDEDEYFVLRAIAPILFMVFIWSYAATKIPILKSFVPGVGGFGGFGLLTFVGVYLAARTSRYYNLEEKVSTRMLVMVAFVSGVFCWLNLMHYHSPFALLFSGSLFYLFKRWYALKDWFVCKAAQLAGPSMFSVYLLHNNTAGMSWLQATEDRLIEVWGYYLICIYVAVVFFC